MLEFQYNLAESMAQKGVIFCFRGPISQDLLLVLGESIRNKMNANDFTYNTVQKVFSSFVEMAQNIIHYSSEREDVNKLGIHNLGAGLLTIGTDNQSVYISSGNKIEKTNVQRIQSKLDPILAMNKDELKIYYKEQRKMAREKSSKGAGLGFIEMARKVESLDYSIKNLDSQHAFFSIKAVV